MIRTKNIKMPAKKMLSTLFLQYGMPWIIITISGVLIFMILGLALNYRFYLLSLIWIFLFVPLILVFLYFFHGLRPLTTFNVMPHHLVFDDDILKVRLSEKAEEDSGEEKERFKEYEVKKSSFVEYKLGGNYALLFFDRQGWLWLPLEAFHSIDCFRKTLDWCDSDRKIS